MPIYDYVCSCGCEFEALSSVANRKTSRCACGGEAAMRVAPVAFYLDPVSGHFPTRTRNWERSHQRANRDDLKSLGLRKEYW